MSQMIFLAAAYAALWIAFFGYSVYLMRRLKKVERELSVLK